MADLDTCVKEILCALSDAALNSLQVLIDSQTAIIQAQIVVIQTQLLQYDVLALPIEASRAAAQLVVDEVRGSAFLIPLNLISESNCVDLGDFNLNLQQSIDAAVAVADDLLFEATRLLSFRDDLNALVTELNAAIDQFTDIKAVISECLAS